MNKQIHSFGVRLLAEIEGAGYYALSGEECEELARLLRLFLDYNEKTDRQAKPSDSEAEAEEERR